MKCPKSDCGKRMRNLGEPGLWKIYICDECGTVVKLPL